MTDHERCISCKHIRYPDNTFDGDCPGCSQWAEDQIVALRAEVARRKEAQEKDGAAMRMAVAELSRRRLEVAALKAKLDKANERAERAGTEWMRAREAWEATVVMLEDDEAVARIDLLDQFFGGGEGQ